jgi:SEL1 protein
MLGVSGTPFRVARTVLICGNMMQIKVRHVSLYSTISADMLPVSVAERARLKREIDSGSKDTSQKDGGAQPIPNQEERAIEEFEDDGKWYIGKASEDFRRRQQGEVARAAAAEDDDDPVQVSISFNIILPQTFLSSTQWARERRNAENERDGDFGPEDYFEAALRGGHRREEEVDELTETMLLVALCALVALLIYVRTRIVRRARGQEQEQQQVQRDLGVFPLPGDPARQEWNIVH